MCAYRVRSSLTGRSSIDPGECGTRTCQPSASVRGTVNLNNRRWHQVEHEMSFLFAQCLTCAKQPQLRGAFRHSTTTTRDVSGGERNDSRARDSGVAAVARQAGYRHLSEQKAHFHLLECHSLLSLRGRWQNYVNGLDCSKTLYAQ